MHSPLTYFLKRLLLFLILPLLFYSCSGNNKVLEREDLFMLPLGYMADELNYFIRPDTRLPGSSDLFIQDGRVYLGSSNSGKIMVLNSYGDLLGFYYNPAINPEPAQYLDKDHENPVAVKKWTFRGIEHLAVSEGTLLVADRVEESQNLVEDNILHNRIILRFDQKGNFIDYLGREGVHGTPFTFIQDLEVTAKGEIVVITNSGGGELVYWFSREGKLLYKVILDQDKLPSMEGAGWNPGVPESIKADQKEHKLYIKIDYFPERDRLDLASVSRLYTLDLEQEIYTGFFDIPALSIELEGQVLDGVYEYLGPVDGNLHFFLGSDFKGHYFLSIMNSEGAVKTKRSMYIQDEGVLFRKFFLAGNGLLAGIFYEPEGARVSWWRTDKVAGRYAE